MKLILVMRHAKSSWKEEGQPDHERPLNERGKRDAPRMGRLLKDQGLRPGRILCSSAKRARKTAKLLAAELGCEDAIEIHDALYGAGPDDYATMLRDLPDTVECAMIVAHDPSISMFVTALARHAAEMPTAAIAHFQVPVGRWNEFALSTPCKLIAHWLPRDLAE